MEPPDPPPEKVHGLDPRALLARASDRFDISMLLRAWEPPPVEEVAALFPQYEILRLIGRGGMGAVYQGRQPLLQRLIAIKLMPPEAAADDQFAARFRVEARALARLQHPNIVSIFDFGQTQDGHLYFVMEYIDGTDLAHLIQAGHLEPAQALEVVIRVCDALQYAHQIGIVHRDIKPGNVLVDRHGAVKVADFGLAKLLPTSDAPRSRHTMTGAVLGTPDYMAPEQLDGGEVDQRADIYSLGVMLYEMLTGQLPRGAWEPPSRKVDTDARLDGVVTKALQNEPAKRYQNASEVRLAVDGIRTSSPSRPPGSRSMLPWMAVATLLVGLGLFTAYHRLSPRPSSAAPSISRPASSSPPAPVDDTILGGLDLRSAVVEGDWRWKEGRRGTVLLHDSAPPDRSRRVSLPVHPGNRAYKLSFRLTLSRDDSDLVAILPVANTGVGMVLNLNRLCGLGLINGARWDQNPSTTRESLPVGRPVECTLKVGQYGTRATIIAEIDGRLFLRWEGLQSELSLFTDPKHGWVLPDATAVGLATYGGGVEISEISVEYQRSGNP